MICHMTASAYSSPQKPYKYLTPMSYKSFIYLMQNRPHLALNYYVILGLCSPDWKSASLGSSAPSWIYNLGTSTGTIEPPLHFAA